MERKRWAALKDRLASLMTITDETPHGIVAQSALGYEVTIELIPGSIEWLVVRAWICNQWEMDLEKMLEHNGRLVYATLALRNGAAWLRLAVPLDSGEGRDLVRLVEMALDAARSLSPHRVEPSAYVGTLFSHYAD